MSDPGGEARIGYTVKEILAEQNKLANERHRDLMVELGKMNNKVEALTSRITIIERDKGNRTYLGAVTGKAWAFAAGLAIIVLNIPSFLFYFHIH